MRLRVKLLNQTIITICADTVDKALSDIQSMDSVSNDRLCLICNGKIVSDESFNDKSLLEDSLLVLAFRFI